MRGLIHTGSHDGHSGCAEALVEACAAMFQADFGVDEIWMILTDPVNGIFDSFFSKDGEQGEAYLEWIISRAYDLTERKERSMT
jgi:hypothetical protein